MHQQANSGRRSNDCLLVDGKLDASTRSASKQYDMLQDVATDVAQLHMDTFPLYLT